MNKRQKAKGKRQKFDKVGAFDSFVRAAFAVLIFSVSIFAQKVEKTPAKTAEKFNVPKVVQIDEKRVPELLKPNGKPLLVNFWATWCVPCREEFPDLVEIDKEFKGKIDFITITLDDPAEINRDVPKFLSEMKAEMPTFLLYTIKESEVISSVSKDWQGGLPFSILYNAKGEIVHTKQGKIKSEVVKAKINELLIKSVADMFDFDFQFRQKNSRDYEKGIQEAKKDVAEGKYIVKAYGFAAGKSDESRRILKDEFGIEYQIFGCDVSDELVEYISGYNKISKAKIKQKFGMDF